MRHYYSIPENAVDPESGAIKGVSLISKGEAAGHYDDDGRQEIIDDVTLSQILQKCFEVKRLKVRADHGSGVMETIGWVENFCMGDNKIIGDMHIYDSEPNKPRIIEIAKKNPGHIGLSVEFSGANEIKGDTTAARCEELHAVALVSDPAANASLFSKPETTKPMPDDTTPEPIEDNKFEELLAKYTALEERLAKLETVPAEDADHQEPDGDEVVVVADDVKDEPSDPNNGGYEDEEKMSKFAAKVAEETLKRYAATVGLAPLKKAGVPVVAKEKSWEDLISDEAANFDGDRVKAEAKLLGKLSDPAVRKAYSAKRPVKVG
jgi:hypothetical protein